MSDYGDEDPYKVERGYKTDSYILAVQGNPLEVETDVILPSTSTNISQTRQQSKVRTRIPPSEEAKIGWPGEVYEAYVVDESLNAEDQLIRRIQQAPIEQPTTYGTLNKKQLDRYRKDECWSSCR
jgi:hypothetical protein